MKNIDNGNDEVFTCFRCGKTVSNFKEIKLEIIFNKVRANYSVEINTVNNGFTKIFCDYCSKVFIEAVKGGMKK